MSLGFPSSEVIGVLSNDKYFRSSRAVSSGFRHGTRCNESLEGENFVQTKSGKVISGQESGQRFNEKCLGLIAELQSNIDQTLMRADVQKEKHKRMYPFVKDTFISRKYGGPQGQSTTQY